MAKAWKAWSCCFFTRSSMLAGVGQWHFRMAKAWKVWSWYFFTRPSMPAGILSAYWWAPCILPQLLDNFSAYRWCKRKVSSVSEWRKLKKHEAGTSLPGHRFSAPHSSHVAIYPYPDLLPLLPSYLSWKASLYPMLAGILPIYWWAPCISPQLPDNFSAYLWCKRKVSSVSKWRKLEKHEADTFLPGHRFSTPHSSRVAIYPHLDLQPLLPSHFSWKAPLYPMPARILPAYRCALCISPQLPDNFPAYLWSKWKVSNIYTSDISSLLLFKAYWRIPWCDISWCLLSPESFHGLHKFCHNCFTTSLPTNDKNKKHPTYTVVISRCCCCLKLVGASRQHITSHSTVIGARAGASMSYTMSAAIVWLFDWVLMM